MPLPDVQLPIMETPEEIMEFINGCPTDLQPVLWGIYTSGVVHTSHGLITYVDLKEDPANAIKEKTRVH